MPISTVTAGNVIDPTAFGNAVVNAINGMAWTSYTPTYANFTLGNGTATHRYAKINDVVFVWDQIVMGSTSTMGTGMTMTLPVTAPGTETFLDGVISSTITNNLTPALWRPSNSSNQALTYSNSAGATSTVFVQCTATVPFTWASGYYITRRGVYRSA